MEAPQICFDFTKGMCTRGDKCKYSHDIATIVHFNSKEKGICFDYLRNQCHRGLLCRFSHDLSNIAQQCQVRAVQVPRWHDPTDRRRSILACSGCSLLPIRRDFWRSGLAVAFCSAAFERCSKSISQADASMRVICYAALPHNGLV